MRRVHRLPFGYLFRYDRGGEAIILVVAWDIPKDGGWRAGAPRDGWDSLSAREQKALQRFRRGDIKGAFETLEDDDEPKVGRPLEKDSTHYGDLVRLYERCQREEEGDRQARDGDTSQPVETWRARMAKRTGKSESWVSDELSEARRLGYPSLNGDDVKVQLIAEAYVSAGWERRDVRPLTHEPNGRERRAEDLRDEVRRLVPAIDLDEQLIARMKSPELIDLLDGLVGREWIGLDHQDGLRAVKALPFVGERKGAQWWVNRAVDAKSLPESASRAPSK